MRRPLALLMSIAAVTGTALAAVPAQASTPERSPESTIATASAPRMFTPTLSPTQEQAAAKQANLLAAQPRGTVTPDINAISCGNRSDFLELYSTSTPHEHCYEYAGMMSVYVLNPTGFCTGNNVGAVQYEAGDFFWSLTLAKNTCYSFGNAFYANRIYIK